MEFLGHINFRQASGRHGAELDGTLGRFKARFKPRVWADSNGPQHGRCCRHDRVVRNHDLCGSQRRQMQRFGVWKAVDGRIGCGCQPVDQLKKGRVFNDSATRPRARHRTSHLAYRPAGSDRIPRAVASMAWLDVRRPYPQFGTRCRNRWRTVYPEPGGARVGVCRALRRQRREFLRILEGAHILQHSDPRADETRRRSRAVFFRGGWHHRA